MQSLGTLSSWIRDGALAGLGLPLVGWSFGLGVGTALYGSPSKWDAVITVVTVSTLCGLLLGPALGALSWWIAAGSRLLALLAGVVGTALGVLAAAWLSLLALGGHWPPEPIFWLLVLAFGATTSLPPGAAYLAVRSRGRSGLPVLLGSAGWLIVPIALAFIGGEVL